MKAAVLEKPGVLRVREIPEPAIGDYDALCELVYGAICTGTDSHIVDGSFPWISPYPTILGHESVGRVVRLGSRVKNFKEGDLITRVGTPPTPDGAYSVTWGGFAELGVARDHQAMAANGLPEAEWNSYRVNQIVPPEIDPRVAPMFTTWRETLSYLLRRGFRAGHSLAVVGSGGNGFSFARHASNLGASKVAMVGAARMEDAAKRHVGVTAYFDYRNENLAADLRDFQPEGFDYVVDSVGQKDVPDQILPCLKPNGHYARYGMDDYHQNAETLDLGAITFHGHGDYDEAETHEAVSNFVRDGKLSATAWYDVEKPWPLEEINAALDAVKNRVSLKALIKLQST